jgi:hypothetical protein
MRRNPLAACILQLPRALSRRLPEAILQESRNALLRIFQVVAANLLAMHSAITKQAPARERFSASFGESFREKQQRSKMT